MLQLQVSWSSKPILSFLLFLPLQKLLLHLVLIMFLQPFFSLLLFGNLLLSVNRRQLLVIGRHTQAANVRLVVLLHRHAARHSPGVQSSRSRSSSAVRMSIVGASGARRERSVAIHAGHDHRSQLSLSLAEQENRLSDFRGLKKKKNKRTKNLLMRGTLWREFFFSRSFFLTVSARTSPARSIFNMVTLSLSRSRKSFSTTVA